MCNAAASEPVAELLLFLHTRSGSHLMLQFRDALRFFGRLFSLFSEVAFALDAESNRECMWTSIVIIIIPTCQRISGGRAAHQLCKY